MLVSEDEKEFTFIWKIGNFSNHPYQNGESLWSPMLVADMWKGVEWRLKLYPRGDRRENIDYVSCFLYAAVMGRMDFEVNFSLTVESTEPTKEITLKMVFPIEEDYQNKGWYSAVSLTEIYANKDLYLPQDTLSLRCLFRPVDSDSERLTMNNKIECASNFMKEVYISRTFIQLQQSSFTWTIHGVNARRERVETTFMMKDTPGLKVTLNFCDIVNKVSVPIEIQQTYPAPLAEKRQRLFVKCKITVVRVDKKYRDSKQSTHLFKSDLNDVWHFPRFIKTSNLKIRKYLKQYDALSLQCEFVFSYCHENPFGFELREKVETSCNWCTRVQNLCASGKFNDVELKAGGETFPALKVVLCASSSVFSAMFENDTKEKTSGVVEIDDIEPAILKRMLTFINFDEIKEKYLPPEDVRKLYTAADKYNIVALKEWCTKSLVSSLSVNNVYDVLVLADAHQDIFLMTIACNLISCHETEIFGSPDWKSFRESNTTLSAKVKHQVLE